jgi:hypothetical protein
LIINNINNENKSSSKGNNQADFSSTTFKSNFFNEEKFKNPLKVYNKNVPNPTKSNLQINFVLKNNKKTHIVNKSSHISPERNLTKYKPDVIIIDNQEVKHLNARSATPKINNNLKKSENIKTINNSHNYNNIVLQTEVGKNISFTKQNIISKSISRENANFKFEKLEEKLFPIKKIVNNKNLDVSSYLEKLKKADFSCCTISSMSIAQEKLQKFCISKNMTIKEVYLIKNR